MMRKKKSPDMSNATKILKTEVIPLTFHELRFIELEQI